MRPHAECGACLIHWVFERTAPYIAERKTRTLVRDIVEVLLHDLSPQANVGSLCNRTVHAALRATPDLASHYRCLKQRSNENAKKIIGEARRYVDGVGSLESKLSRACYLAAASNVAPLNAPASPYTFQEVHDLMQRQGADRAVIGDLFDAAKNARHVLYVADNAGEIGFDSLAIQQIKRWGAKVTLVVKKQTFFEDVTREDTRAFGLGKLVDEIIAAPGFLVPDEMDEHTAASFRSSDLVISKGTGSYEALHGEIRDKRAVFMLKVKCRPIARELGLNEGNIIVKTE